jgi:hypothetical protein
MTDRFPMDRVNGTQDTYYYTLAQLLAVLSQASAITNAISEAVAAEAALRQAGDTTEIQARSQAISALQSALGGSIEGLQQAVQALQAAVNLLEGKATRYSVSFSNDHPTQEQIQAAYEAASSKSGEAPDNTVLVDAARNITYTWFTTESQWVYTGADTLPPFTNQVGGYIQGRIVDNPTWNGQYGGSIVSEDSLGHGTLAAWHSLVDKLIADEVHTQEQDDLITWLIQMIQALIPKRRITYSGVQRVTYNGVPRITYH